MQLESISNEDISKKIRNLKVKRSIASIKNGFKICAKGAALGAIVAVPAAIVGGFGIYTHQLPFCLDEREQYERTRIEYCSDGEMTIDSQYESFEDVKNSFNLYSEWTPVEDGYSRTVKTYNIDNKRLDDIKALSKKDDLEVEDVLGEAIHTTQEVRKEVTVDEMSSGAYFEAVLYDVNRDKTIIVKQTPKEEAYDICYGTMAYLFLLVIAGLGYIKLKEWGILDKLEPDFVPEYTTYEIESLEKQLGKTK